MCNVIRFGVVAWIVGVAASAHGQEVTRVNVSSSGDEATDGSGDAAISSDGRYVAFSRYANNLVAGDTNGFADVFAADRTVVADQACWNNSAKRVVARNRSMSEGMEMHFGH